MLDLAELLSIDPSRVDMDLFSRLRSYFTDAQIVEACFFVLFNNIPHRFAAALEVDPEDHDHAVLKSNPFLTEAG